jgi:cytochrome P450
MGAEEERPQTFVDWVLALLEERFPWLGSGQDEPVGGADTVDELADLYKSLIEQRDKARRENGDPRA